MSGISIAYIEIISNSLTYIEDYGLHARYDYIKRCLIRCENLYELGNYAIYYNSDSNIISFCDLINLKLVKDYAFVNSTISN